jgi:conjugative transfer signal peptidase TraF
MLSSRLHSLREHPLYHTGVVRTALLVVSVLLFFLALRYLVLPFVVLNTTPSLSTGLYLTHLSADPDRVQVGDVLMFCPDHPATVLARERGYIPERRPHSLTVPCPGGLTPLSKRVLALPGDSVTVALDGLYRNGRQVLPSPPRCDSKGRPIPILYGTHRVPENSFWMASDHHLGYDSRVIGPVVFSRVVTEISLFLPFGPQSPSLDPSPSSLRASCSDPGAPPASPQTVNIQREIYEASASPHLAVTPPVDSPSHPAGHLFVTRR